MGRAGSKSNMTRKINRNAARGRHTSSTPKCLDDMIVTQQKLKTIVKQFNTTTNKETRESLKNWYMVTYHDLLKLDKACVVAKVGVTMSNKRKQELQNVFRLMCEVISEMD